MSVVCSLTRGKAPVREGYATRELSCQWWKRRESQFTCRRRCRSLRPCPFGSKNSTRRPHSTGFLGLKRFKVPSVVVYALFILVIYSHAGRCTPAIYFTTIISGSGWRSAAWSTMRQSVDFADSRLVSCVPRLPHSLSGASSRFKRRFEDVSPIRQTFTFA